MATGSPAGERTAPTAGPAAPGTAALGPRGSGPQERPGPSRSEIDEATRGQSKEGNETGRANTACAQAATETAADAARAAAFGCEVGIRCRPGGRGAGHLGPLPRAGPTARSGAEPATAGAAARRGHLTAAEPEWGRAGPSNGRQPGARQSRAGPPAHCRPRGIGATIKKSAAAAVANASSGPRPEESGTTGCPLTTIGEGARGAHTGGRFWSAANQRQGQLLGGCERPPAGAAATDGHQRARRCGPLRPRGVLRDTRRGAHRCKEKTPTVVGSAGLPPGPPGGRHSAIPRAPRASGIRGGRTTGPGLAGWGA